MDASEALPTKDQLLPSSPGAIQRLWHLHLTELAMSGQSRARLRGYPNGWSGRGFLICCAVWWRWFARSEGRVELRRILRALARATHSQEEDEPTKEKAVAAECRTASPNTCHAGPSRISLSKDKDMERLDLSVIYRIRPSAGPLFNRQEIRSCQQILLVYPVRTIVDSDTESEGRSRPATPTPDEGVTPGSTRAEDHAAPDNCTETAFPVMWRRQSL